jgi:hypothetical protein
MARDRLTKSAAAFLAKSVRPRCSRCGGASPAGSKRCAHCGTALLAAVKAGDGRRDALLAKIHSEPNSLYREAWWRQLAALDRADGSAS